MIEHQTSDLSLDDLLQIETTQPRADHLPTALPLKDLRVAPEVFQWRHFDSEIAAEEAHVAELVRVLQATEAPLDPILVTPVGSSFFVVDGHHRLLAYRAAKWSEMVPVVHFEGTVEEARLEALRLNIKNKLPMTQDDKFEAAWTLAKEGLKFSKSEMHTLTTVGERTIATMRAVLRDFPQAKDMSWKRARALRSEKEYDFDSQLEKKAEEMAKKLLKPLGTNPTRRSEIIALALSKLDKALPSALVRHWPEEVTAFADEMAQTEGLDI